MALLVGWVRNVLTLVLNVFLGGSGEILLPVFTTISSCFLLRSLRRWARDREAIGARLQNFSVRRCICACEEDRPVVYRNIAALMRETLPDVDLTDDDEALEAFDILVRTDLPLAFSSSLGKTFMPYKYVAAVFASWDLPNMIDLLAGMTGGMPIRDTARWALWYLPLALSIYPLALISTERMTSCFLHLRG
mmetsp:Transcript_58074/g.152005  ORF Transcript_58074/g.152005 Transcript_58074/m.152005 type:complete len:192 (+) Transcript_58074:1-576(+)